MESIWPPAINMRAFTWGDVIMKVLFIFLFVAFPIMLHAQKQGKARVDSLIGELNAPNYGKRHDTEKIRLLNNLSFAVRNINPDEGLKYANQALGLSAQAGWEKGKGLSYNAIYANYSVKGDTQALGYCFKSLKIFEALGIKKSIAANYGNIADCYNDRHDYAKALEYETKELKIAEDMENDRLTADCFFNMGNTFMLLRKYPEANEYFFNALQIQEKLGNQQGVAQCWANIGSTYLIEDSNELALGYTLKAINLFDSVGDQGDVPTCIEAAGIVYSKLKNFVKALEFQSRSLKISEERGDKSGIAHGLNAIGITYLNAATDSSRGAPPGGLLPTGKHANLDSAISYIGQSNAVAKSLNDLQLMVENYQNFIRIYKQEKRYDKALEYYELLSHTYSSIYDADKDLKTSELEAELERTQKQKEIELNRIEKVKERNELILFIVGAGLLLAVVVLVFDNYKRQKRLNARLAKVNNHLAEEKIKSDELQGNLRESLLQQEELATQLTISSNMKSRFLANISHELRTPATLLTGMLELMKDESGVRAAGSGQRLEVAYNNSRKLQYMIEELLDLSRLENREPQLNAEAKEIAPLLRNMVYAFEPLIEQTHLSLEFTEKDTQGIFVDVDESKLEKIINNLVYNAIKFNRPGGWVKVALYLSENKRQFIFSVGNSGNGITAADLPHVFERFYQGATATAKAEGMGIGLALVKEFTVLMGGEVHVQNTAGEGAAFTLLFPVTKKTDATNDADVEVLLPPAQEWEHFPERQTVLVVDDNAEMRYYVKEILGKQVNLAEAGNGTEALIWLGKNTPDLIISDIMMPEMDGREFITLLKNDTSFKRIPIITLTALADTQNLMGMLRIGVDDYMVKPFNADELRVRAYNLLNNSYERKKYNEQPTEEDDIKTESADAEALRNKITAYVLSRLKNTAVSVYDLADELCVSERQLQRLTRRLTGCSPAQLIKEVRLQKAYELLIAGQIQKVDDVARQVGFESSSYFSRQFAERFGKRPTEMI